MNVQRLIDSLTEAVAHGLDPSDEVEAWDPDGDGMFPITGYTYGSQSVQLCTDCEEEEPG